MIITNVKVNGIENPVGYTLDSVSVSWNVEEAAGQKQAEAKIEVSLSEDFASILYEKKGELAQAGTELELTLTPCTAYYYRITVTDETGDQAVSDVCTFETGKMGTPWTAQWISAEREDTFHPVFTKKFTTAGEVRKARLYITGVGLFEAYVNGKKLGEEYLTPYVTNYETNIQIITFPVENLEQENTLEILLGKGWYMGMFGLGLTANNYGDRMAAIAELQIEYADGSKETVITDDSWTYRGSMIEDSGIYDGEIYNRMLWDGKENPEKQAVVLEAPENEKGTENLAKSHLMDRLSLPVLAMEEIAVKQIIHTPAGETVLDLGQNFAGFMEFTAELPKGTTVTLDFAEILQEGNFYHGNYRDAKSQFVYVSDGEKEVVRPHFTFFGFRYVRVTGWPGEIAPGTFVGKVLYSAITRTGYLRTSNEKINRLYENTVWGLKSNFIDMPTDCPQRSERLGWTGDAQVFAPTASYHMDTRAFFHKFIKDLRDEQKFINGAIPNFVPNIGHDPAASSIWADIATFLPNTLYTYYGSTAEIRYSYEMMKDWVDYIYRRDGERGERTYKYDFEDTFGDWLALDGATPTSFKGSTDDTYLSTVYYFRSAQIVSEMAERIGETADAAKYKALSEKIFEVLLDEFYTPSGRLAIDTQAAYVTALKFGVYRDREKLVEQFKVRLKKDMYELKCGFAGAPMLCTVMAEAGLFETAYDFLLKETFPSWLFSVNLGATTIWERWNSVGEDGVISDTGMNSLNHYSYGSVMEFVYAYTAGIRPAAPGFKKAIIEPHPDIRLPEIQCSYLSVNGRYVVDYTIGADGRISAHIVIPFDCEAQVTLPGYPEGTLTLGAGNYDFEYAPQKNYRKPYHAGTTLLRYAQNPAALGILFKYVPPFGGIAASGNKEMGSNTLDQLAALGYIPFDPEALEQAKKELFDLTV